MGKITLGTVQFGMDYGINNKRGKVPKKEVFAILDYALKNDVNILDTAQSYGDSEKVIGDFIRKRKANFQVISKLPGTISSRDIDKILKDSLTNLNIKVFYGYLIHDFNSFLKNPKIYETLKMYKTHGTIKKLGFSLYHPQELEYLLQNNIAFDLIQIPYNLFDQRFEPYFKTLKDRGVEIHVRSVFLQGLLFKKPHELPEFLLKAKDNLRILNDLSKENNLTIESICINFALANENIDHVVLGVDNVLNLKDNLSVLKDQNIILKFYDKLKMLKIENEQIILPTTWKN